MKGKIAICTSFGKDGPEKGFYASGPLQQVQFVRDTDDDGIYIRMDAISRNQDDLYTFEVFMEEEALCSILAAVDKMKQENKDKRGILGYLPASEIIKG